MRSSSPCARASDGSRKMPLTPYIGRPNPYNAGTELEGKPLRATFKDGMRLAYVKEIQEYMVVPLSLFGGILSPVAKDLVAALRRVRDG